MYWGRRFSFGGSSSTNPRGCGLLLARLLPSRSPGTYERHASTELDLLDCEPTGVPWDRHDYGRAADHRVHPNGGDDRRLRTGTGVRVDVPERGVQVRARALCE